MSIGEDTIREQLRETLKRFDEKLSAGNMTLREFGLFFSYINCLLGNINKNERGDENDTSPKIFSNPYYSPENTSNPPTPPFLKGRGGITNFFHHPLCLFKTLTFHK